VNQANAIELKNITKRFGKVIANESVNLTLQKGEILSILGENGSGKTTLMNMLSGIYMPDEGQIFMDGKEVSIHSPKDALDLKIGMIHQHFKLIDILTAAENIILGLPGSRVLNTNEIEQEIKKIIESYGFDLNPSQKIYDMSVSQKQTVEIIKVLYRGANVLILDEPTAVLTPQETDKLFAILRNMKKSGKSIIIITHKLQEVLNLSDRVAVLRKGKYMGSVNTKEATVGGLTEMMVGEKIELDIKRSDPVNPQVRLKIDNLTVKNIEGIKVVNEVSFTSNSGEILGIAGIAGSGQKELLEAIAGLEKIEDGKIIYHACDGNEVLLSELSPEGIKNQGVNYSFVPEDRLGMGLVGNMDITDNIMLRSYRNGKSIFTDRKAPKRLALDIIQELGVVTPGVTTPVRRLSGGNVQKVLVGREIACKPNVLMVAYPVRGLDINSSYMIYNLLNDQKEQGSAVICVIEDLDVLIDLCDRIIVLCNGKITGTLDARKTTKEEVGMLMTKDTKEGE